MISTVMAIFSQPGWRKAGAILSVILLGLGLILLATTLYNQSGVLIEHLQTADLRKLPSVLFWYTVSTFFFGATWFAILEASGGRTQVGNHFVAFALANAGKRLPGTLWYVGGRVMFYRDWGISAQAVLISSGIEFVIVWLSGALVAIPFVAISLPQQTWLAVTLAVVLIAGLNPWTLRWVLSRRVRGWQGNVRLYHIYSWLTLSALGWLAGGMLLFTIVSIFQTIDWWRAPYVIADWAISGTVSMLATALPTNFGVTELTLTALLSRIMPTSVAALIAVSSRIIITFCDLLLGIAGLLARGLVRQE